jgi:hypothetical protein
VFAAIERAIGDGSSASVSYVAFSLDHHIARKAVSPSLKLLDHLGLIDIEPGPRLVNVFRFSNRWRTIDEVEAVRLAELAREVQPHRTFEKRRGDELRDLPLIERKRRLAKLIGKAKRRAIRFNEHLTGDGPTVFEHVCRMGLEGIVSKRVDAPYRSGPSKTWVKTKNPESAAVRREQEEQWR